MKLLVTICVILLIVGGLNWGLVGLLNYNLVEALFGTGTVTNLVYDLVGLAAIVKLVAWIQKMSK